MCPSSATDVCVIETRDNFLKLVKSHSLGWRLTGTDLNGAAHRQSLFCRSRRNQALEATRMKRHISVVLLDACEEALLSMAGNAEYEQAHFDRPPSTWVNWVMWWRGFAAGVSGDRNNIPILDRLRSYLEIFRAKIVRWLHQTLSTRSTMIRRSSNKSLSTGPFRNGWSEQASLLDVRVDMDSNRSVSSIGSTGHGKGHMPLHGDVPSIGAHQ